MIISETSNRVNSRWLQTCVVLCVMVVLAAGQFASASAKPEGAVNLFDGKGLTGWEYYLVKPDLKMADVWSVRDGLLICKGEPMGYLATKKEFTNFQLIVEWRWAPGKPAGNSGVLLRITGEPRALPKCVEAQLQSGNAGDIYGFQGFQVKGDAARSKSAEGQMIGKLSGVSKIKGNEKEPGQWNKYDITFSNGDLTLIVNGEKVNEATGCDVVAGKIGLQSEGGEIHFRTVRLISFENKVSTAKDTKPSVQIPKPGIQVNAAKEVTLGTGDSAKKATVHYLISLPENYNEQDKCPLLIFLHGRGECGNDLNRVKVHGPPKIVKKKNTTPFVIVSPQCPKRESWRIEKLSKLLDHILATTKADPERVYLTGLSLGGFGTWAWAAQEPKRFAAAIPICGGGNPDAAEKLVKLPIWAFHGGKDTVVSLSRSEAMVEAIKKAGGTEVKLTIYPEAGHDSWTKTYNNPEIYKWLLTHKADDVVTNSIGMKLVYIPAGSFVMGSKRQHQVRISKGFWMGQTEVTQGQYKSVMNAQPWSGKPRVQEDANNPAVYVSWDDAVEFCSKLSQQEGKTYRLPTEAEWEYACRAGTTTRFSFGESYSSLGDYAWFRDNTHRVDQKYAHAVGQKKPNPWGIYDMHGNVFEWCSDYYDKGYYSNSPSVDPNGPSSGISRCLRGGSWIILVPYLRCYHRYGDYPGFRHCSVGFRFVRSQP